MLNVSKGLLRLCEFERVQKCNGPVKFSLNLRATRSCKVRVTQTVGGFGAQCATRDCEEHSKSELEHSEAFYVYAQSCMIRENSGKSAYPWNHMSYLFLF